MAKYDYLIVGAGLFGAVFAHEAERQGKHCLVIDRRAHIGGNCYTEKIDGVEVHVYGAHIFRTADKKIWDFMAQFAEFNHFVNSPVANYNGEIYNLPFNMNTFSKMWGIFTPAEAQAIIEKQRQEIAHEPQNLEEHVIRLVGRDVYEKLVKGYTEKQWGKPCSALPSSIIRRIPLRFTYDNNYFNDPYQGIPKSGYTSVIAKMLQNSDVKLGEDFLKDREKWSEVAGKIIYTGAIDEYFDFCHGELEWRSLMFETETLDTDNYQGVAVVNYTDRETPYTRIIEHKHFVFGTQANTVITREFPCEWRRGIEPYYPINDDKNQATYEKYRQKSRELGEKIIFGGRLGEYMYYDMQDTIKSAIKLAQKELNK